MIILHPSSGTKNKTKKKEATRAFHPSRSLCIFLHPEDGGSPLQVNVYIV
jgi:hypothetical protein